MAIPVGRSAKTERSLAEKVALAAMLGYALAAIEMQAVVFHSLVPPIGIINLVAAMAVIGPLLGRWRWAPLLAPIVSLIVIVWAFPFIVLDLTHPSEDAHGFVWTLIVLVLLAIASVAGALAVLRDRGALARSNP